MTRSWTIEDHGARPLTVNRVITLHRMGRFAAYGEECVEALHNVGVVRVRSEAA